MVKRNFILFILLVFFNGCGYTPLYQGIENLKFSIEIIDENGDREINKAIKSNLRRFQKDGRKLDYEIKIETRTEEKIITKNKTGAISKIKLISVISFDVSDGKLNRKFQFKEEANIEKNNNTIEEKKYENKVKENMGNSASEKLVFNLLKLNDR